MFQVSRRLINSHRTVTMRYNSCKVRREGKIETGQIGVLFLHENPEEGTQITTSAPHGVYGGGLGRLGLVQSWPAAGREILSSNENQR